MQPTVAKSDIKMRSVILRLDEKLLSDITAAAEKNGRSRNAEIVARLKGDPAERKLVGHSAKGVPVYNVSESHEKAVAMPMLSKPSIKPNHGINCHCWMCK